VGGEAKLRPRKKTWEKKKKRKGIDVYWCGALKQTLAFGTKIPLPKEYYDKRGKGTVERQNLPI